MYIKKIKDLKVGDYIYILECKQLPSDFYKRKIVEITKEELSIGTYNVIKYYEDDILKYPSGWDFKEDGYNKHVYVNINNINDYKIAENYANMYYSDLNQLQLYVESLYNDYKKEVVNKSKIFDNNLNAIKKEMLYCNFEKLQSIEQLQSRMLLYNPDFGNYEVLDVDKNNNTFEIEIIDNLPTNHYEIINELNAIGELNIFNGNWLIVNESQ